MQSWSHSIFKRCNTRWLSSEKWERYLRHVQWLSVSEFLNTFCQWPRFSGLLASQKNPSCQVVTQIWARRTFVICFFKSTEAKAPKGRHRQDGNLFFRLEIEQTNISTSVLEYILCPCILSDTMQGYGTTRGDSSARVRIHSLYHKCILKISQLKILYLTFQNDECL